MLLERFHPLELKKNLKCFQVVGFLMTPTKLLYQDGNLILKGRHVPSLISYLNL
jgi:hypothetical protein